MYSSEAFKAVNLDPPTSVEDFMTACEKLKQSGVTPVATSFETWALRIVFDEILAGTMSAQGFDDFLKGKALATDPKVKAQIRSAIATFGKVLSDYVDRDAASSQDYSWTNAFGPPGASDLFVYGADTFALPSTAPHAALGKDFLGVVASKQGQVLFNKHKGATPMRTDVSDDLDAPGQQNLDALEHAKGLMPGHPNDTWDDGIAAFVLDGDQDALLQVYLTATP